MTPEPPRRTHYAVVVIACLVSIWSAAVATGAANTARLESTSVPVLLDATGPEFSGGTDRGAYGWPQWSCDTRMRIHNRGGVLDRCPLTDHAEPLHGLQGTNEADRVLGCSPRCGRWSTRSPPRATARARSVRPLRYPFTIGRRGGAPLPRELCEHPVFGDPPAGPVVTDLGLSVLDRDTVSGEWTTPPSV